MDGGEPPPADAAACVLVVLSSHAATPHSQSQQPGLGRHCAPCIARPAGSPRSAHTDRRRTSRSTMLCTAFRSARSACMHAGRRASWRARASRRDTRHADELVDRGHGTGTCWPHAGAARQRPIDDDQGASRRRSPRSSQPCDAKHVTATGRPASAPNDTTSKRARGFIIFLVADRSVVIYCL
jgi:hypothetical protein